MPQLGIRLAQSRGAFAIAALMSVGSAAWAAGLLPHVISQAGRVFSPGEITINRGETVQFFNDDADLVHHVYLDSDLLKFDSGDQQPGSRTNIIFPVPGDFTALCAIHPKMKLVVHVK
jgi:plastocyanin